MRFGKFGNREGRRRIYFISPTPHPYFLSFQMSESLRFTTPRKAGPGTTRGHISETHLASTSLPAELEAASPGILTDLSSQAPVDGMQALEALIAVGRRNHASRVNLLQVQPGMLSKGFPTTRSHLLSLYKPGLRAVSQEKGSEKP